MAIQKKAAAVKPSLAQIMQAKAQRIEGTPSLMSAKPVLKQISAKIPTDVHTQVRIKCLQEGVEMQHVIADLLADWVRK